jgi:hypothetical protein
MRTLIDEYGDTGILQPPYEENRRDGDGQQLGPKPRWLARMFYDMKQIRRVVEPRLPKETPADVQNQDISGP